jgi:hypothetical protein
MLFRLGMAGINLARERGIRGLGRLNKRLNVRESDILVLSYEGFADMHSGFVIFSHYRFYKPKYKDCIHDLEGKG